MWAAQFARARPAPVIEVVQATASYNDTWQYAHFEIAYFSLYAASNFRD